MRRGIYLSIDIDFWDEAETANKAITNILDKLPKGTPKLAVMNHQQLLKAVNNSNANTLINIDTHSDFAGSTVNELNCGTWVAYVNWREEGRYVWYRSGPNSDQGRCDWNGNSWNSGTDWMITKTAHREQNYNFSEHLKLDNVVGVGICLSPDFNNDKLFFGVKGGFTALGVRKTFEEVFRELIKKYNIPYLKGRRDEQFGIYRIPSGVKMCYKQRLEEGNKYE